MKTVSSPVMSHVKAMWLSQFDLHRVYTQNGTQRKESDFRSLLDTVLRNIDSDGFNTLFVQVRPNADSIYPSDIYPPSVYSVGCYGNGFAYDPFGILVAEARKYGFSVHAWINPMRCMTVSELLQISDGYLLKQWYNRNETREQYITEYEGRLYLNPAYSQVRDMIVSGADEIIKRYDVDGIHMDDYFYPSQAAPCFDASAYNQYLNEGGTDSLEDWRRNNLSLLVSSLYATMKKYGKGRLFGISPAGVFHTVQNKQYADVTRWCRESGFIDYILPQVYFGFEHATVPFDTVCHTWENLIQTDCVTLLIGMSFGKALSKYDRYAGTGQYEWANHTDIMKRCLQYTASLPKCRGISVFCYQYFYDPVSGLPIEHTQAERDNFLTLLQKMTWSENQ